jgi:hypothetical protein
VYDGIAEMLDYAKQASMPLAIEPVASGLCRRPRLRQHHKTSA